MSMPGRREPRKQPARACWLLLLMLVLIAVALLAAGPAPTAVPWSTIRSLDGGLIREVRVWRTGPGEATVQIIRDGVELDHSLIELDVPETPSEILLREEDLADLACVRVIAPGWRATRALSWARAPDATLADAALENALPDWKGGAALIWYFGDLIVIAHVENGIITEMHEVFEPGTVELRNEVDRARAELNRSLQRIHNRD